ncbi:MAG: MurR/RpiR family transcriptional regulator, partial [Candidatus Caldatribacteriota bacterium]|nr:MurR/RpiR family transcriptional regulator [Candidatus Caldatribacteriota bacterium]
MIPKKEKNQIDLQSRIKKNYKKFSEGQKLIAEYLLNHSDKATFLTAANLGKIIGVSESTVVRFANFLDYKGYPSLQKDLQNRITNKLNTVSRLKKSIKTANSGESILYEVFRNDTNNIQNTINNISQKSFDRLVKEMLNAEYIYIIGLRTATSLAYFMGYTLHLILKNVTTITYGVSDLFERLININEKDLLIGITFPRYTLQTVEIMEYAKKKGAKTAAITDKVISPLAQLADVSVFAESNLNSFIDSFTAPLSLINALVTAVGVRRKKENLESLSELEEIW